ncbi:hypothetical protein CAPTEDRAFT_17809 [Capitella teleta]|uniref:Mitogen-activated protein kinase kinase kinase 7 n=1 Tax=Capitella teleta TaxID=283909 RepID=R7UIK6_CAPTE|nr:hypothetical protein CAPTEDRAFT_17809 [Capitella teleta]|eukprot:ELU03623.1 hypothetical protein CAPTEDRAFT_17809 [Capitella teleta]
MALNSGFVEEIDYHELQFFEVVGRGAFGVVSRARWKEINVAVKLIETESEKKAFITELKQLSRVNHPNIVKLYGACTKQPVCLVMEYAEGGSLYNVLHGSGSQPEYTAGHAISWALQSASGVAYLHGMKPKPLVHRDLKPPNLLLNRGGTVLRICDFGTACDAHTHMTNNKGSAAWMAPEVFEGNNYSEKCDVFSWGIILWEVLTRRKPFDDIGGPAFRIMWAVHNGTRPPLIQDCPKPIETLMTRCWSSNPMERPSMNEVERVMRQLMPFFNGADQPLRYPQPDEPEGRMSDSDLTGLTHGSTGRTILETMRYQTHGEPVPMVQPSVVSKVVVFEDKHRRTSAPASLAASRESLNDGTRPPHTASPVDSFNKRFSADLSKLDEGNIMQSVASGRTNVARGHRRTGSHGTNFLSTPSVAWSPPKGHRRTGSFGNTPLPSESPHGVTHSITAPELNATTPQSLNPEAWNTNVPPQGFQFKGMLSSYGSEVSGIDRSMIIVDHELQPLAPYPTSQESIGIFEQHVRYTQEYIRVKTEIELLKQEKENLMNILETDKQEQESSLKVIKEYTDLVSENEQLGLLQKNLKLQLDQLKKSQRTAQCSV